MSRLAGLAALLALGLLAACGRATEVTLHEPGVYKGPADPLLAKLEQGALREQLDSRFQGQTDR